MSLPTPTLASGTSAFSLASPSFSVTLPNTVDSSEEQRSWKNYIETPEGLDGGIKTRDSSREPMGFSLSGVLFSSATAQDLRRVAGDRTVTVTRDGLSLSGEVNEFTIKEVGDGSIWNFSISITCPNPYWLASTTTTASDPVTLTNSGDVYVYPRIIVTGGTGGATAATISLDGRSVVYTGVIGDGEALVIDCFEGQVALEGTNVLSSMNDSFFTNPLRINPGSSSPTYSITGTATVTFSYQERYL